MTLEEAKKINLSLSCLCNVIHCLTTNNSSIYGSINPLASSVNSNNMNGVFVPYRNSKLTRLLKDSLNGIQKTSMIMTCSLRN